LTRRAPAGGDAGAGRGRRREGGLPAGEGLDVGGLGPGLRAERGPRGEGLAHLAGGGRLAGGARLGARLADGDGGLRAVDGGLAVDRQRDLRRIDSGPGGGRGLRDIRGRGGQGRAAGHARVDRGARLVGDRGGAVDGALRLPVGGRRRRHRADGHARRVGRLRLGLEALLAAFRKGGPGRGLLEQRGESTAAAARIRSGRRASAGRRHIKGEDELGVHQIVE